MGATAWGKAHLLLAETDGSGTMPQNLVDCGAILQDSITVETTEGTVLELRETGGGLLDQLQQEDTLKISVTSVGTDPEFRDNLEKVFDVQSDGTKATIKSTVKSGKYAGQFRSEVVGSDFMEFYKASIHGTLNWVENQGWTLVMSLTLMKADNGNIFAVDTIPAPATEPEE